MRNEEIEPFVHEWSSKKIPYLPQDYADLRSLHRLNSPPSFDWPNQTISPNHISPTHKKNELKTSFFKGKTLPNLPPQIPINFLQFLQVLLHFLHHTHQHNHKTERETRLDKIRFIFHQKQPTISFPPNLIVHCFILIG